MDEAETNLRITEIRAPVESKQNSYQPQQVTSTAEEIAVIKGWLNVRQCDEEKDGIEPVPNSCEWILSQWLYGAQVVGSPFFTPKFLTIRCKVSHCNVHTSSSVVPMAAMEQLQPCSDRGHSNWQDCSPMQRNSHIMHTWLAARTARQRPKKSKLSFFPV